LSHWVSPVYLYISYKYGGENETFVSPPSYPELRSNALTPSDPDDATYIDEEEEDKKPPAKNTEKKDKSPGGKFSKIKAMIEKNVQVSAVAPAAAAVAALHADVGEVEDTDYGGGCSNWSSDSYEGVVAPNSPPTPPPEVKKKTKNSFSPSTNKN